MGLRNFRNGPATGLTSGIGAADVSMTVDDASGFPALFPYTLVVDLDQPTEEVVDVTAGAGNLLTITRGADSTTAFAHSAGATIVHGTSARDAREANQHVNATADVHGVTGDLMGTTMVQTASGKTFTAPTINGGTVAGAAIGTSDITGSTLGAGNDIQLPLAADKLVIRNTAGVEVGSIDGNGHLIAPRVEVVGTSTSLPTLKIKGPAGLTDNLLTIQDSGSLGALNVSATRRVGINTSPGAASTLYVKSVAAGDQGLLIQGAVSQTGDLLRISDSAAGILAYVNSAGDLHVAGNITSDDTTDWATYTPFWSGSGYLTREGRWKRIAKKTVAFTIQITFSIDGTGTTDLTFTLPTAPSRTTRQSFNGHMSNTHQPISAVTFTGGSGTTVDQIVHANATSSGIMKGENINADSIVTISGVYEEA